jgi:hypothetical protein
MTEDAAAALQYLLNTRHLNASAIIPYGQGLGTVFAAKLASSQPQIPALILDNPDPNIYDRIANESRGGLLPMRLLMRDRFDLAAALTGAATKPKLLIAADSSTRVAETQAFFRTLPTPKLTVTLPPNSDAAYLESIARFLDEYLTFPH